MVVPKKVVALRQKDVVSSEDARLRTLFESQKERGIAGPNGYRF